MTKKSFTDFLALPDEEKVEIFERAEARLDIPPHYVEKGMRRFPVLSALPPKTGCAPCWRGTSPPCRK